MGYRNGWLPLSLLIVCGCSQILFGDRDNYVLPVETEGGSGTSSSSASSSSSSSTSGTGGMGGGGMGGVGGMGGASVGGTGGMGGGAPACSKTCADAITDGLVVCMDSPASLQLYNALVACMCERAAMDPMPGCKDDCVDNLCAGMDVTTDCGKCVQTGACMSEFGVCASDL